MAHYRVVLCWDQSNGEGRLNKSNAPAGMFTINSVNGVLQWNGTVLSAFNVKDEGPAGNGHSYIGDGQSDDCYAYTHELCWMLSQHYGEDIVLITITNGGSILRVGTNVNGSHNVDVATLAANHPTSTLLHTALEDRFNSFDAFCSSNSHTYEVLTCVTSQGEADADDLSSRLSDMEAKRDSIRTLVGNPNLPYIIITQGVTSNFLRPYADEVAHAMGSDSYVVKGFNLPNFDGAHHTEEAITHIAKRCFVIITGEEPDEIIVSVTFPSIIGSTFNTLEHYLSEANVTDPVEEQAAEYLYTELKSNNLWDSVVGLFPMLGTNYSKNLRNPFYRNLTLTGASPVAGGLNFDGTNDEASTGFRVQDLQTMRTSNFNVFGYLTENNLGVSRCFASWAGGNEGRFWAPFFSSPNNSLRMYISESAVLATVNVADVRGLINFGVKDGNATIHQNGANIRTVSYSANHFVTRPIIFGKDFDGNDFLDNVVPLLGYSHGLSDEQVSTLNTIVQNALSIIGRNI